MPDVTIIYWRDIPAQVIVGSGRKATKRELPERFQQAIDAAAMRSGARDTDAYLADWHKVPLGARDGEAEAVVASVAEEITNLYEGGRLARLVEAGGQES
ncbi:MAG: virulence factor [Ancalomicrobiaceae bacterium]|nr:virulence factor [Ancalomicrobiaceae bacterium]